MCSKIKPFFICYIFILGIIQNSIAQTANKYNDFPDTLVLNMTKYSGYGPYFKYIGASNLIYHDKLKKQTNNPFIKFLPELKGVPKDIDSVKFATEILNFFQANYENNLDRNDKDISYGELDSNKYLSQHLPMNTLSFLTGIKNHKQVFIIDQNNNHDFSDDTIRDLNQLNFESNDSLMKFYFNSICDGKIHKDSGYIKVGWLNNPKNIYLSYSKYYKKNVIIGDKKFVIGMFTSNENNTPNETKISLLFDGEKEVNNPEEADLISLNKFIKLNNVNYKFIDVSIDGRKIILVKDKNEKERSKLQKGLKVPDFTCVTIDSNKVKLNDFKNSFLLVVNLPMNAFSDFDKLTKDISDVDIKYLTLTNAKPEVFSKEIKKYSGFHAAITDSLNVEIGKTFISNFDKQMCYLINKDGIIVDEFLLYNWKESLLIILTKNRDKL